MKVRVGDIADQIRGVSYAKSDAASEPRPGSLPILRANNITDDGLVFDDLIYVPHRRISVLQALQRHDVVVAASSGSLDVVGKAAQLQEPFEGAFGAFCKVLRPNPELVDPIYFSHFFRTRAYRQTISSLAAGANINNLKNEHLDELEIPLPPLEEQRRIATILDTADALRRKRKKSIDLLNTVAQSTFVEMFGDPTEPGKGRKLALGEVVRDIESGWSPVCLDHPAGEGEAGILKLSAITSCEYLDRENKALPPGITPKGKTEVLAGDLLLCRKNTRELVGASVFVWDTRPQLYMSDLIFRLVPDLDKIDPVFLQAQLSLPSQRRKLSELSGGAAGSMPNISKAKLRELEIALPSLAAQRAFSDAISRHRELYKRCAASLDRMEALFSSLQHRAFSGQL